MALECPYDWVESDASVETIVLVLKFITRIVPLWYPTAACLPVIAILFRYKRHCVILLSVPKEIQTYYCTIWKKYAGFWLISISLCKNFADAIWHFQHVNLSSVQTY